MNYEINGVTVGEIWDAACAGKPVTFRFVYEGEIVGVTPLETIGKENGFVVFPVFLAHEGTITFGGSYPNGIPSTDDGGGDVN